MSLPTSSTTLVAIHAGIRAASASSSSLKTGLPSSLQRNRTRCHGIALFSASTRSLAVGVRTHSRRPPGRSSGWGEGERRRSVRFMPRWPRRPCTGQTR
jgi:hypothetical protein